MKYLQFNEKGILALVSKTKVSENDLEVEDNYNFKKETEVDFSGELIKVSIDKTKDEILDDLFPKLSEEEDRKQEYKTKLSAINTEYDLAIANLSRGVPDTERSTWTKQEQEAKEVIAGSTNVPMLLALATARGIPLDYLAEKVIEKANLYSTIVGQLTGKRQRDEDLLKEEYKDIL